MTTSVEVHNRVVGDLMRRLVTEARVDGRAATPEEILVILESLLLGCVLAIEQIDGRPRRVSVEALELMVERVEERLGALPHGGVPTMKERG